MIQIRKAYPTDAYSLIQISDVVFKNEFYDVLPNGIMIQQLKEVDSRVRHLKDQINENNRIFVAIDDSLQEKIVGFIFYGKTANVVYNEAMEIRSIYIMDAYQKQGIGTQLFEKVIQEVKKLHIHSLIVNCPVNSRCIDFFEKLGGDTREVSLGQMYGYQVKFQLIYFDLDYDVSQSLKQKDWNRLYSEAQNRLILLNDIHKEVAVILTDKQKLYFGLGIKNRVCPMESALANMYLAEEVRIQKILILNRQSKPVLPCGKCRDLLIELGQEQAEILFDMGTFQTMTMGELNPYYKNEEKNIEKL